VQIILPPKDIKHKQRFAWRVFFNPNKNFMSLTNCPECNKDVSSQATVCPHCGYPLSANEDKTHQKPEGVFQSLESFKLKIQDKRIFFHPNIPPQMLQKVGSTYAKAAAGKNETILCLMNETAFAGNASDGFAITADAIYWHNMLQPDGMIPFSEVTEVIYKKGIINKALKINGSVEILTTMPEARSMELIVEMINVLSNQNFKTASPTPTLAPIQPQGQMLPIASGTSSSPKKKMSKAKLGCLVFLAAVALLILLGIIGALTGESPEDSIPKSVVITSDQVVFDSWSNLQEFHNAAFQIAGAYADAIKAFDKTHPTDGMNDQQLEAYAKQLETFNEQGQRDMNSGLASLRLKFEAENRILKVPVSTEIEIAKFYDVKGSEITPMWNDLVKKVCSPDGNAAYPSGEWNGKTVYVFQIDDPPEPAHSPWWSL
jgi:hypothetical protein